MARAIARATEPMRLVSWRALGLGRGLASSSAAAQRTEIWRSFKRSKTQAEAAKALQKLEPLQDAREYTTGISVLGQVLDWERALELLRAMGTDRAQHVEPNVFSYSAAIAACERASQPKAVFELLERMRAARIAPNVITYTTVLAACCTDGYYTRAPEVWSEMRADGIEPNLRTYGTVCGAMSVAITLTTAWSPTCAPMTCMLYTHL